MSDLNFKINNNILVIMSDNRDIVNNLNECNYNTLCALINYNYCKKNNYDFKYYRPNNSGDFSLNNCHSPSGNLRHSSWAKLLSTIKAMLDYKQYDYIVYIDSDCIFNNINLKIDEYYSNFKIINGGDINKANILFLNDKPWYFNSPCAGYYILKNNNESFSFIKNWYSLDGDGINMCDINHPYEQWALYTMFNLTNPEEYLLIDDIMFIDEDKNQFLRHISSAEANNRLPFFKNKLNELSLTENFTELANELKNEIITFDTNELYYKIKDIENI
jgi:hypothetical protein